MLPKSFSTGNNLRDKDRRRRFLSVAGRVESPPSEHTCPLLTEVIARRVGAERQPLGGAGCLIASVALGVSLIVGTGSERRSS